MIKSQRSSNFETDKKPIQLKMKNGENNRWGLLMFRLHLIILNKQRTSLLLVLHILSGQIYDTHSTFIWPSFFM